MIFSGARRFGLLLTGARVRPMWIQARAWRCLLVIAVVLAGLLVAGPVTAEGQPAGSQDALTAARYSVVVDGYEIAAFNDLVALNRQLDKPPTIELAGPLTGDKAVDSWYQAEKEGSLSARKAMSLILYNTEGTPVVKYYCTSAYPSRIVVSGLKAGSSEILRQQVTFTAESIQRVAVP